MMEISTMLFLVLFFIFIFLISIYHLKPSTNIITRQLPPGPKPYPIIGNILEISKDFHRSFERLSKTYGPIISLRLGNKLVVVVSSPEIAKEIIMKNHERITSSASSPIASRVQDHHRYALILRSNKEWPKLRKICKEHMFSTRCLDASQHLRKEMMMRMCDYVRNCSVEGRAIDVGEASFVTMLNLLSASLFSTDAAVTEYESGDAHEFRESVEGVMKALTTPNIADLFPILKPFDPQGIKKLAELHFGKLFSIFDVFINRRLEARRRGGNNFEEGAKKKKNSDMLETLIGITEKSDNDGEFTCRDIRHLIVDLYFAGTSTTSTTVEWIMTELLRNPNIMSKVQDEVRTVFGDDQVVAESDIMSKLPYLSAVIKETLRHHPPGSIFGRALEHDVIVNRGGYVIPKGSQVLFNVFAMGRDPDEWSDPEKFDPERFIDNNNNTDYKGQHFQFIPFGSGKRVCPGLPLADRMIHNMVATLVHKFDWKLTVKPEDLDMDEKFRFALQKKFPLMAIPVNRPCD